MTSQGPSGQPGCSEGKADKGHEEAGHEPQCREELRSQGRLQLCIEARLHRFQLALEYVHPALEPDRELVDVKAQVTLGCHVSPSHWRKVVHQCVRFFATEHLFELEVHLVSGTLIRGHCAPPSDAATRRPEGEESGRQNPICGSDTPRFGGPWARSIGPVSAGPKCGHENRPEARFCNSCGSPLAVQPSAPVREERKTVTVLFADLVGFTTQAEQLDPEDVRRLLQPYYSRLRHELERHGGTVEKFIGDAVMALFGAPVAHEDDPERAVRAAIAIRNAISEADSPLQVRIAVNTGEALVALGARPTEGEGMASGDVVNTAARMQTAAPVNGILVGEKTYRATNQVIEYREAEPIQAKGKQDPVPVWEAVAARSRFGLDVEQAPRTPLVGRERELAFLTDALERARSENEPQLVTLVGVPGIGKSRLVAELYQFVDRDPDLIWWRQGRSLPYGDGLSYWALAEIVKAQAGIAENDSEEIASEKLRTAIESVLPEDSTETDWVEQHLRPLVGLSGAAGGDSQTEAHSAWRRFFEGLSEGRPTVLVFEDLHWADDGLLDFIDYLVDWASAVPLLVVCMARPELLDRRPGWGGGKRNAATATIGALSQEDTARLLADLLEQTLLPAEIHEAVLQRAEGNPLYAEEYVRMLRDRGLLQRCESGWRLSDREDLPLPETVQGMIAARLDALPPEEKELIQDAAVVGKVFWPGALAALERREATAVEHGLHALERKEFVRRERASVVAGGRQFAV